MRLGADRRHLSVGAQQPGLLERREIKVGPLRLARREREQRRRGVGGGEDRVAQPLRLPGLEGDEFGARHRRRRSEDVEAERNEGNLVAARRRGVRLIEADEIELVENILCRGQLFGDEVLCRLPPIFKSPLAALEQAVERWEGRRHLVTEGVERSEEHTYELQSLMRL